MNAIHILALGLLFAVTPANTNGTGEPRPTLPPAGDRPAVSSILGQDASTSQPEPVPRSPAELAEENRQLKQALRFAAIAVEDTAKLREQNRQLEAEAARSREQIRQQGERIAALERRLPPQGPQFQETRQPTGTLVLDNRTLNTHTVSVNGFLYSVVPGRAKIGIPIDTASVYLPLNESPKQWGLDHWRWTGQNYEMLIVIGN